MTEKYGYDFALDLFEDNVWKPEDNTDCFWYRKYGGFYYSLNGEDSTDPEQWCEGGYSSERVRQYVEKGDYVLVTLGDCSGWRYQAIFSKDKEIVE